MQHQFFLQLTFLTFCVLVSVCQKRSFEVDYENDQFLKDGQPFRYVSGAMHYFRVPRELWRDRLRKMKYGGLNAVQTYVEWSSHEPHPGQYDFEGQNDLIEFIRMAQQEDLLAILRVGPYICAERDMGGFPYWLLQIPGIKIRQFDSNYLKPVLRWLNVLLPKIKPLLYQNGGPIIMVQFENEYGGFDCNQDYIDFIRDEFLSILGFDVVLFTTDGNIDYTLRCGHTKYTLTTLDIDDWETCNITEAINILRQYMPNGPLVNSEFYTGWIDKWEQKYESYDSEIYAEKLDEFLQNNFSVNIYLYHGGTNFGFKSSGFMWNQKSFQPVMTSYDFDAPISESGDFTQKFFDIKEVIRKYLPVVENEFSVIPNKSEKMSLPPISMSFGGTIFDHKPGEWIESRYPLSFEDVDHDYGFLLYQTNITFHPHNPALLSVPGLRDRAHVFVDNTWAGILSRSQQYFNLSILVRNGSELSIFVENQGRCSWGWKLPDWNCLEEKKGIVSNVTIDGHVIENWSIYKYFQDWKNVLENLTNLPVRPVDYRIPSFYFANFALPNKPDYPLDSFIRVDGWTKGVAFLNGHNLGRYWPPAGPQITLYAPKVYFNEPDIPNQIVLLELDDTPCWHQTDCTMRFVSEHIINGTYPN